MRRLPAAVLACAALAAPAACGDDESVPPAAEGPDTVVMTDYAFHPRELDVPRRQDVTVLNEGGIAHNLTVERGRNPRHSTDPVVRTASFLKGDRETLRVDIAPGRYVMVCTVPGHRELGMTGTLVVREP